MKAINPKANIQTNTNPLSTRWKINFVVCMIIILTLPVICQATPSFNVRDFGASGEKSQNAQEAIEKAIRKVQEQGGGTVYFPAGSYTSGTIELVDNLVLHFEAGASLYASNDVSAYQGRSHEESNMPMLLYAKNKKNIKICGSGSIIGEPRFEHKPAVPYDFIEKEYAIAKDAGMDLNVPFRVPPSITLLYFTECDQVTIEGVSIIDSPFWAVHLHWCDRVFVRGVSITSSLDMGVNSDGLDIDGCSHVMVSDCYISTGDDAIVLKTTNFNGAHRPCQEITVTNCVLESTSGALKLGTESHDDFTRITFTNCVIRNSNRGLGIFIRDGGKASEVIFSNVIMECNRKDFHWWGDGDMARFILIRRTPESRLGSIENITISNIRGIVQGTSLFTSKEAASLKNIKIQNIHLKMEAESTADKRATNAMTFEKIEDLQIEDVHIVWDSMKTEKLWKHAIQISDVQNLVLGNIQVSSQKSAGATSGIQLNQIKNARVSNVYSFDKPEGLLRISGRQNGNISIRDMDKKSVVIDAESRKSVRF
ncbi:MAG: glycoside hydrolase family 28 protein [Cyclobacteriaceae bacterium]